MTDSMTPIERAARRAYSADWPESHHAGWDDTAPDMRARYTAIGRAALEAIREPSPDMVDAGRDVGPDAPYGLNEVRERWTVMIDAALEEG